MHGWMLWGMPWKVRRVTKPMAKTAIVQKSSYEHTELVVAGDVVLEMGNTALDDAQTLEDEGVEENATLTMIVDMDDEVTNELITLIL